MSDKLLSAEEILRKHGKIKENIGRFNFRNHTLVTVKQALSAMEEYKSQSTGEVEGWIPVDAMPKDGTVIVRWHKLWDVPIAVKFMPGKFQHDWIEGTLRHSWPEEAFLPIWQPLPPKPVKQ